MANIGIGPRKIRCAVLENRRADCPSFDHDAPVGAPARCRKIDSGRAALYAGILGIGDKRQ